MVTWCDKMAVFGMVTHYVLTSFWWWRGAIGAWWFRYYFTICKILIQWRYNDHLRLDCLLNRLFRCRSKKSSKLRVTGLCKGNSPVTGEFSTQKASYAENVSIWWHHHVLQVFLRVLCYKGIGKLVLSDSPQRDKIHSIFCLFFTEKIHPRFCLVFLVLD